MLLDGASPLRLAVMDLGRCVLPSSEVAQARSRAVDITGRTTSRTEVQQKSRAVVAESEIGL